MIENRSPGEKSREYNKWWRELFYGGNEEKRKWETKEQLKNRVMSVIDKYKEKFKDKIYVGCLASKKHDK